MLGKLACLLSSILVAMGVLPQTAHAWNNGPSNGNGYGSHDWILDHAIELAGQRGAWVDRTAALHATDDPDSRHVPSRYHLFRNSSSSRGAAHAVTSHYYSAIVDLRRGDNRQASVELGLLSHYYSDVLNPFHADARGLKHRKTHADYEHAVSKLQVDRWATPGLLEPRPPRPVQDIRSKTVSAAYFSRGRYNLLIKKFKVTRGLNDTTTASLTGDLVSRACNDLADIICSINMGEGTSKVPAKINTDVSSRFPARNSKVAVSARCLDKNGHPIEGVGVKFCWKFPWGTKSDLQFSDSKGQVKDAEKIHSSPLMKEVKVVVVQATSSKTRSASTWFMATPRLAAGRRGMHAHVSQLHPRRNSSVTVSAVCKDKSGHAVKGLPVTFTWRFATKTVVRHRVTGRSGIARCSVDIGNARPGYRVSVGARTSSGGVGRSTTVRLTPR